MNGCERFNAELSGYHDRALTPAASADVERHLQTCEPCRIELGRLRALDHSIRALPRLELSPGFEETLYARLAREPLGASRIIPLRRRGPLAWLAAGVSAAAAASLLVFLDRNGPTPTPTPTPMPTTAGDDVRLVAEQGLVADQETFDLLMHEDPAALTKDEDPELLYTLDLLERWDDGGES